MMKDPEGFRRAFGKLLAQHGLLGGVAIGMDRDLFHTFASGKNDIALAGMEELRGRIESRLTSGEFDPSLAVLPAEGSG